jgi:hypothetical protein
MDGVSRVVVATLHGDLSAQRGGAKATSRSSIGSAVAAPDALAVVSLFACRVRLSCFVMRDPFLRVFSRQMSVPRRCSDEGPVTRG